VGEGKEFDKDGSVRPLARCAIACWLPEWVPLWRSVFNIERAVFDRANTHFGKEGVFKLLPSSDWHVPIFDCIDRESSGIDSDASPDQCNASLESSGLSVKMPIRMEIYGIVCDDSGIWFSLRPADQNEEKKMHDLRVWLSTHFELLQGDPKNYKHQLRLAYLMKEVEADKLSSFKDILKRFLPREQKFVVEFRTIEFCRYYSVLMPSRLVTLAKGGRPLDVWTGPERHDELDVFLH
jgi:hypothetical protein